MSALDLIEDVNIIKITWLPIERRGSWFVYLSCENGKIVRLENDMMRLSKHLEVGNIKLLEEQNIGFDDAEGELLEILGNFIVVYKLYIDSNAEPELNPQDRYLGGICIEDHKASQIFHIMAAGQPAHLTLIDGGATFPFCESEYPLSFYTIHS